MNYKGKVMKRKKYCSNYYIMIILLSLFGIITFCQHNAVAGENPVFSLSESIKIAQYKSYAINSAIQTVEGAEYEKKKAFKSFLPSVSANYTYTKLNRAPEMSLFTRNTSVEVGTKDNYLARLTLSQPIFAGFKIRTAYDLAKLGFDVAQLSRTQAELDLVLNVKEAYFRILQTQKAAGVAKQSVRQMEDHLNVAENFYKTGMTTKNQVLEAEVKLAESMQTRIESENAIVMAKANFNTFLNRAIDASVEVEDILKYKLFLYDFKYCLDQAFINRPEIKAAQKNIKIAKKNVSLAKGDLYPTIGITANYNLEGDTWEVNGSDYIDDNESWDVSIPFTWTWEWGKSYNNTYKMKTELKKTQNTLAQIKDRVSLEVKNIYLLLKVEEKNISLAQKAIEQAEENFRINQERYTSQIGTSTEVIDAATLLTAAQRTYYDALYSYNLAWANIERAMGKK